MIDTYTNKGIELGGKVEKRKPQSHKDGAMAERFGTRISTKTQWKQARERYQVMMLSRNKAIEGAGRAFFGVHLQF